MIIHRIRRANATARIAIVLVLLLAVSLGTLSRQSVHASPVGTAAVDPADALEALGENSYPEVFAGIQKLDDGQRIAVYVTDPAPAIQAVFTALAGSVPLTFLRAPKPFSVLSANHQKMSDAWMSLLDRGVQVNGFHADMVTGLEQVAVVNLKASDTEAINALLGPDAANVYSVSEEWAKGNVVSTRLHDTSPYNGGDGASDGYLNCTTGFGVTIAGQARLTTAAHCYANGDNFVVNQIYDYTTGTFSGGGASFGTVTSRQITYNPTTSRYEGTDAEVLTAAGSNLIWRGDIGAAYRATVSGRLGDYTGDQVCQSGVYSGETCSTVTGTTNACQTLTDSNGTAYYLCHLYLATRTDGGIANEEGNSGGPVFRISGGLVYASGLDTGQINTTTYATGCVHYNPNACSSALWLTGEYYVLQSLGATLNTG